MRRHLHMSHNVLKYLLREFGIDIHDESTWDPSTDKVCRSLKWIGDRVRTLPEIEQFFDMDPCVWEMERVVVNGWDVSAKIDNKMVKKQNNQIKVWFKRKIPYSVEDALNRILVKFEKHTPKRHAHAFDTPKDPHLLVISLPDAHIGMLAWERNTGNNYDTEIACALYVETAKKLLGLASGFELDEILLVIGNDLFHANDHSTLTPKSGNRLDVDSRFSHIFESTVDAHIALIDLFVGIAPVRVLWVPGNHDPEIGWYLAKVIEAWYRAVPEVVVDVEPTPRKHYRYGVNLLAWTHGDEEKEARLPAIMAMSWPEDWARSVYREWQIGHWHRKKELLTTPVSEVDGVRVRTLPSLSAKDRWHVLKGYQSIRAGEAYLYSKADGYTGHFSVVIK